MRDATADDAPEDPGAPEVLEGRLDLDGIEAYFRDLEQLAEIDTILVRWADGAGGKEPTATFEESRDAVRSGTAHAIQIRYRYEEAAWCDTLLADAEGHRILRVRS